MDKYAAVTSLLDAMMARYRVEVLGYAASGTLNDPEVASIWMDLFEQCDPPFAAKLKTLLGAPTQQILAELSTELFPGEIVRPYDPTAGPGEYA